MYRMDQPPEKTERFKMDHSEVFRLNRAEQLKTLQVPKEPKTLKLDQVEHPKNVAKMTAFIAARIRALSNRVPTDILSDDQRTNNKGAIQGQKATRQTTKPEHRVQGGRTRTPLYCRSQRQRHPK